MDTGLSAHGVSGSISATSTKVSKILLDANPCADADFNRLSGSFLTDPEFDRFEL